MNQYDSNSSGTERNGTERNGTERNGGKNNNSNEIDFPFKGNAKKRFRIEQPSRAVRLRLSILICTYNRADTLKKCLENMTTIAADKALYEIIVINNNSTDHTNEICQDFATKHTDVPFRYVFEAQSKKWNACNRAVAEAQFELLSFMDDDQTVQPNYVDVILKAFEDYPEYTAIAGRMFPIGEDGKEMKFYSRYFNPFYKTDLGDVPKEYPKKPSLLNPTVFTPPGGTITFRAKWFEEYGDWGEMPHPKDASEDMFMAFKLREHGQKILYMPSIVIHHHIPKERCEYKAITQFAYRIAKAQAEQKRSSLKSRVAKFVVCVGVGLFYFITLRPVKGGYLIAHQYNWLKGYIEGMKTI